MEERINNLKILTETADVLFLSFPKSGRTWIRFFIAKYIELNFNLEFNLELPHQNKLPNLFFTHNYFDIYQGHPGIPEILFRELLEQKKIILIIRDPRDVAVSFYFQKSLRENKQLPNIDEFVLSDIYGIERQSEFVLKLINFFNEKPDNKLLVTYEGLKQSPVVNFERIVEFIFGAYDDEVLTKAVKLSDFKQMKSFEIELSKTAKDKTELDRIGSSDWKNSNALKVRNGKSGSYKDELKPETIEVINKLEKTQKLISIINKLNKKTLF